MTREELANFFEAEGGIIINKHPPSYNLTIAVGNDVKEAVDDFCETTRFGRVELNRSKDGANHWLWRVGGSEAKSVLQKMLPYLSLKRTQAELAIEHLQDQEENNLHLGRTGKSSDKIEAWKNETVSRRKTRYLLLKKMLRNPDSFTVESKRSPSARALASFADGEANIQIRRQRPRKGRHTVTYKLVVKVSNVCIHKLEQYQTKYGGSIGRVGCTKVHEWEVTGNAAAKFLASVYPFLRITDLQAWLGICFYEHFARYVKHNGGHQFVERDELELRERAAMMMQRLHKVDAGTSNSEQNDFRQVAADIKALVDAFDLTPSMRLPVFPDSGRFRFERLGQHFSGPNA